MYVVKMHVLAHILIAFRKQSTSVTISKLAELAEPRHSTDIIHSFKASVRDLFYTFLLQSLFSSTAKASRQVSAAPQ